VAWTAIGLAVRVGYVLLAERHRALGGDPQYFHALAQMVRHGRGWNDPYLYGFMIGLHPTATHPPLYPLLLAGSSFVGFESVLAHRLFSCLIGTATIPLVALVARRYGGGHAGVIAAAIAAVYPYLWANDTNLLSESLLAVLIALVLLVAEATAREPTVRRGALLGATIALAALTRSEQLLLVPLLAWPLLLRGADPLRQRLIRAGAATLAALVLVAPWVGWNLTRFEHPVFMSANLGVTLFDTNCDRVWYGPRIGWWTLVPYSCPNDVGPAPPYDESTRDLRLRNVAWKYVSANADRAPVVIAARVGRIWGVFNPRQTRQFDQEADRGKWPTWIGLVCFYPLLLLALSGLFRLRRRGISVLPFVALAAVVTVTAAVFYGTPRFRVPVDVGIVVLAAVALDAMLAARRAGALHVDELRP
jgi:4-amino-4-deoxy-L-arabinose transferase-like glycosyltransferase